MKRRLCALLLIVSIGLLATTLHTLAAGEAARVYNSSNISTSTGSWTKLTFDSESYDWIGYHSGSSGDLIIPSGYGGAYMISCHIYWGGNSTGRRGVAIYLYHNSIWTPIAENVVPAGVANAIYQSVATSYFVVDSDRFGCYVFQDSGGDLNIIRTSAYSPEFALFYATGSSPLPTCTPAPTATPQPTPTPPNALATVVYNHHVRHEDGGADEVNVTNLSGLLADAQDAGWFRDQAITVTDVISGQVLAWYTPLSIWRPTTIIATGGYTMSDVITVTISGPIPLPVAISDTWHYTQTLSTGNDIAIIRSFTFGEAAVTIALLALLAFLVVRWLFEVL